MNQTPLVLFIVFDGLRPDHMTPTETPALWDLAGRGVRFLDHHSIYPTLTRVNVGSMFTGCLPARHGVVGNAIYRPDVDPSWEISTGRQSDIARLQERLGQGITTAPTLGEVLRQHGEAMTVVGVGSSGNTFLQHPNAGSTGGVVVHPEFTVPDPLAAELSDRFGPWPAEGVPNGARNERAATVLLEFLLPAYSPAVATIWMSDPDNAQHKTGIGSAKSVEGARIADRQLARIVAHLEDHGMADTTDIFVVSDHGHSTVLEVIDVEGLLIDAGLKESRESTDVLVAENGGSALVYVPDGNGRLVEEVARLLMSQPWCGPLFTRLGREQVAGTMPLSAVGYDHPTSPDILLSLAWDAQTNRYGVRGRFYSCGSPGVGLGNHGSASPYEIHNTLVAAGPHFKKGVASPTPSSNADLFPTILSILGLEGGSPTDGRVLEEALLGGPEPEEVFVSTSILEESADLGEVVYSQQVQVSRVAGTTYLDKARAERR